MYRYPIRLTLKSGEIVEGIALDIQSNELKEECIELTNKDNDSKLVILDDISKLEVDVDNPHFREVVF